MVWLMLGLNVTKSRILRLRNKVRRSASFQTTAMKLPNGGWVLLGKRSERVTRGCRTSELCLYSFFAPADETLQCDKCRENSKKPVCIVLGTDKKCQACIKNKHGCYWSGEKRNGTKQIKRAAKGGKDEVAGLREKKTRRAAGGEASTDTKMGLLKGPGVVDGGEYIVAALGSF